MRKRNVILSLVAAAAVGAVIFFVAISLPRLSTELSVVAPDQPGPATPINVVASDLQWTVSAGTIGSWVVNETVVGTDGLLYAVSTAPGLRDMPGGQPPTFAVYRSENGADWTSEIVTGLGEDLWVRGIAQTGSHLYLVGTAPSVADPSAAVLRVGTSTDQGRSWTPIDLSLEAVAPANLGPVFNGSVGVDIVSSPLGTLAGAGTVYSVDYSRHVPPGLLNGSSFVERTVDGLVVFDFAEMEAASRACEVAVSQTPPGGGRPAACLRMEQLGDEPTLRWSSTWDELGLIPDPDASIDLFFAADGASFQRVAVPFAVGYRLERLGATATALYAIVRPGGAASLARHIPLQLWRSVDGTTWEQVEDFPATENVALLGELNGQAVAVGQGEFGVVIGSSADGTRWETYDVAELLPLANPESQWISAAAVGPAGLFVNVWTWIQTGGQEGGREVVQIIETPDLQSWSSIPTQTLVTGLVEQMAVGEDFVFLNATTGAVEGRVHIMATRG